MFVIGCALVAAVAGADESRNTGHFRTGHASQISDLNAGSATPASVHTSLHDLSERVAALEAENRSLRATAPPGELETAPMWPWGPPPGMELQGRIHFDVWTYPHSTPGTNAFESGDATITPQDRLELRRARFAVLGELPGDTIYKLDFELSEAADPQFRDLYVGWKNVPVFQTLIVGNQKRPYGLDHLNSSNFNVFMERPLVVQAFNRNNRRLGLLSYGVTQDEAWNWRGGVVNLREIQSDGLYASDHWQLELVGRLARSFWNTEDESRYLHLGVASSLAVPDGNPGPGRAINQARFRTEPETRSRSTWLDTGAIAGAESFSVLATELVFNRGRFQAVAEYQNIWLNRDPAVGDNVFFYGGYLYLSYFLTPHYQPWNRNSGILGRVRSLTGEEDENWWCYNAWQLAVRGSYADLSDSDILGGVGKNLTVGLNWYWTPRSRLQLNCVYSDISNHMPVDGQTFGSALSLGGRVQVDF